MISSSFTHTVTLLAGAAGETSGGGNWFTPSVTARPAPTALPGSVITGS